jgi:ankyrin repeat protein
MNKMMVAFACLILLIPSISRGMNFQALTQAALQEQRNVRLVVAAQDGDLKMVNLLIQGGAFINSRVQGGVTPLHQASQNGYLEVVKYLCDKQANIQIQDWEMYTPLHQASKNGHAPIVDFLLKKGARPDHLSASGDSPLLLASQNGHRDVVLLLFEAGRKAGIDTRMMVNTKNIKGLSPLGQASQEGCVTLIPDLIREGADVNGQDELGQTPLHMASGYGHADAARLLLEHGADTDIVDKKGNTAVACAKNQETKALFSQKNSQSFCSIQ